LKLQQLDLTIRKTGHDLQQIPKQSKLIDEKIKDVKAPWEEALAEMSAIESAGGVEAGLMEMEEKERSLRRKMPEIRTNEEYSALLKEIDATKKEREAVEGRSLKAMERLEELRKSLPKLEAAYKSGEEKVAAERAGLKKEQQRLEALLLEAKKERQALQSSLHPGWFRKYNTIAAQRNGLAVAAVKGGICQGCFMSLRPKLIQDLLYGEEVVFCEGCQRILYLEENQPGS
jgi:hypothetical protein